MIVKALSAYRCPYQNLRDHAVVGKSPLYLMLKVTAWQDVP